MRPTFNSKGNQPWIFIGRIDAEAPVLWPPNEKSWCIGKDPDAGKDRRQEGKGKTENEMIGWHHQLNGHEFEQAPGDGEGQGSLACCSPWGHKEVQVMSQRTRLSDWTTKTYFNNYLISLRLPVCCLLLFGSSSPPFCYHFPPQPICHILILFSLSSVCSSVA